MVSHTDTFSNRKTADLKQIFDNEQERLEQIEKRLGTDAEQPSDFEKAREIAHRISNLKMLLSLSSRTSGKVPVI